jgi:hypothetical protein
MLAFFQHVDDQGARSQADRGRSPSPRSRLLARLAANLPFVTGSGHVQIKSVNLRSTQGVAVAALLAAEEHHSPMSRTL